MIRAEFSAQMCRDHTSLPAWRNFDTFEALRDFIKPYAFAHTYRMRTHQNEHGRVTSREFLAVADDGREFYLGNLKNGAITAPSNANPLATYYPCCDCMIGKGTEYCQAN